jgi:hypothetical protein
MSQPPAPSITIRHYQAIAGLALVALFLVQMQQNVNVLLNAIMLFIGTVCLLFPVRFSPLVVFIVLAVGQLLEQQSQNQFFNPDQRPFRFLDLFDVMLSGATLIYLVGQYRLHGLWFHVLPHDPRLPSVPPSGTGARSAQARAEQTLHPGELLWLILPLPFFALAAEFCLLLLKQHWDLVGYPPRWRQFLLIVWLLVFGMFLAAQAFRYWRRTQMDRASAQLLLQDVLWHATRGEQRRINRWLAWRKRKDREEAE